MDKRNHRLTGILDETFRSLRSGLEAHEPEMRLREVGTVESIGEGIAVLRGLPGLQADELVQFPGAVMGMAFNLDPGAVGIVMLDEGEHIEAGDDVYRTGRVLDVPVGEGLLGRVVDALGRPLDDRGRVVFTERRAVEHAAPAIMDRAPVATPLQTGIKVIDALIPIGRGQRELILGDRQTGKTAIAVDTIINQRGGDVICVYCSIGKQAASVAGVVERLRDHGAIDYTCVVSAGGDDPPGLQFIAPYAATTIAEFFLDAGRDVLVVYDDLTWHARAYRQIALLLRRPPGREAYPGDIFYIHARMLERSTQLRSARGGGSLTALPIIETEAQNLAAYIPTNLISITDGQIYLSPVEFQRGILPAVDVGRSVSRVGGKAQLPAYRAVAGTLRLSYAQFQELEAFARFSTRLDEQTRRTIERGRRVREVLKQLQFAPIPVAEQIAVMLAVNDGVFDPLALEQIGDAEKAVRSAVGEHLPEVCQSIESGEALSDDARAAVLREAKSAVESMQSHGDD